MNALLEHMITVLVAYFAIMNPVANTAAFIGLTANQSADEQRAIARRSLLYAFGIVVVFAILGHAIFLMFGLSLPALRITGGILVAMVGFNMLQGEKSNLQHNEEKSDVDIAISPLAMPLLAGPGTIATTMNFAANPGHGEILVTVSMFFLLCLITYTFFIHSKKIVSVFGQRGLDIITRMMGLILAIMGIQMLLTGMGGALDIYLGK